MDDLLKLALEEHKKYQGKLSVEVKVPMKDKRDLSLYYTPGVAEPCKVIAEDEATVYDYTGKGNTVAVISDGSAVLGLGNIGAKASIPVMEGKCALLKAFSGIDAIPLCLETQDVQEIVQIVKALEPTLGGINLEDISAPRCFEIEERLIEEMNIPIFHDDQHGTAIVCLAGLINALKVVGKKAEEVRVVVSGAGAAGIAITKLFLKYGFGDIILQDSRGLIYEGREEGMNKYKDEIAKVTNRDALKGGLEVAMEGADVFVGVSKPGIVSKEMVRSMASDPIIFAMANPVQEISPEDAAEAGAAVIATGGSNYPNQVNNVLVFPGIFKGVLQARGRKITDEMKLAAAEALAELVEEPSAEKIIPDAFEPGVADVVAEAVAKLV